MKTSRNIIIVLMVAVVLYGCSKSNSNNISPAAAAAGFMKANIGDSLFTVNGVSGGFGAYAGLVSSGGINNITIYGVTTWNKTIQIVLVNDTGIGTFQLPSTVVQAYYYPNGLSGSSSVYAQSGTIAITEFKPTIVGTFNFICTDNTRIVNGSFSVPAP